MKSEDDYLIDLTKSSMKYKSTVPRVADFIEVTKDYEMRPDLIAQLFYGGTDHTDYLLKFNGISNPFSIKTGDVLLIPDYREMEENLFLPKIDDNDFNKKRDNVIEETPTKKTRDLSKFIRQKALEKKKQDEKALLPPNINKDGDQNIKFRDGKIIFGEDVTNMNLASCPETLSRTRVKEKLLKSKIFQ